MASERWQRLRAVGGKITKAILIYGSQGADDADSILTAFGIEVARVSSPAEAADFLIKRA